MPFIIQISGFKKEWLNNFQIAAYKSHKFYAEILTAARKFFQPMEFLHNWLNAGTRPMYCITLWQNSRTISAGISSGISCTFSNYLMKFCTILGVWIFRNSTNISSKNYSFGWFYMMFWLILIFYVFFSTR